MGCKRYDGCIICGLFQISGQSVPRFTGKTPITGKTAELPERPKNNRKILMDASANFENIH